MLFEFFCYNSAQEKIIIDRDRIMFSEEFTVSKLVEKVNDLLSRFEDLKAQNSTLRQEVMTLKAQNEAKDAQILKLQEELTAKNIESDDILGRIEEVLRR